MKDYVNYIKLFVFLGLIGWAIVNVAGFVMALFTDGSAGHLATHIALAIACGAGAWFVRPRFGSPSVVEPDKRVDLLEDEMTALQRQLSETQKKLEFTEQLLTKRPPTQSPKDQA